MTANYQIPKRTQIISPPNLPISPHNSNRISTQNTPYKYGKFYSVFIRKSTRGLVEWVLCGMGSWEVQNGGVWGGGTPPPPAEDREHLASFDSYF
jgi:hypothetical protein